MATILNIREKLNRLVAEGKSGVLALFDAADSAAGYDYIVYLHSLSIVYVVDSVSEASGYFDSSDAQSLNRWVAPFADRENAISLNDIAADENIFLNIKDIKSISTHHKSFDFCDGLIFNSYTSPPGD